ncbi:MAG TPA: response regulator, partial [Vicinamibacterales bacterium]|nr:response regulator [Vicinamibacterales bacterium]
KLRVAAHLTKPIKQSDLLDTLLSIFGERAANRGPAADLAPPARKVSVLLAEDNQVNRQFVTRVLQKRGHSVTVAVNGRQAIDAIERRRPRSFDVVLMDVQMPELDGLSATGLIREAEQQSGDHLCIVAMTAHAMAGDRDRCIAAGMDDYITKPIRPSELCAAVERTADAARPGDRGIDGDAASAFDVDRALARLDGDRALLNEMIAVFRTESSTLMAAIRRAAQRADTDAVARAAHTLKGATGTLGAPRAFDATKRVEAAARKRETPAALLADLDREFAALIRALPAPPEKKHRIRSKRSRPNRRPHGGSPSKVRDQTRAHARRRR